MIPGGVQEKVHFTTWYLDWHGGNDERNKESNLLKHVRAYKNLYNQWEAEQQSVGKLRYKKGIRDTPLLFGDWRDPRLKYIWNLPIKGLAVSNCIWNFTAGPCAKSKAVHCKVLAAESPRCRFCFLCTTIGFPMGISISTILDGSKMPVFFRVPKIQSHNYWISHVNIHCNMKGPFLGNFIISVSYPLISGHFSWWATSCNVDPSTQCATPQCGAR